MLGKDTNRRAFVLVALAVLLALSALLGARAASANNVPREGTRINLFPGFVGPTIYPSRTPFFVSHGWGCNAQAAPPVTPTAASGRRLRSSSSSTEARFPR